MRIRLRQLAVHPFARRRRLAEVLAERTAALLAAVVGVVSGPHHAKDKALAMAAETDSTFVKTGFVTK